MESITNTNDILYFQCMHACMHAWFKCQCISHGMRIHSCRDSDCPLTHWGRVTHICVSQLTIIGPDNGLSPARSQAITWTNVGILLIGSLGTNFSEMLIEIHTFSFKNIHLKMLSGKWRPFCFGLNVLQSSRNHVSTSALSDVEFKCQT